MAKFECFAVDFPLKYPFKIARGTKFAAKNIVLRWEGPWGLAYGECAPNARYGESQQEALLIFNSLKEALSAFEPNSLSAIQEFLITHKLMGGAYAAGLEMLLLDAWSKSQSVSLSSLLATPKLHTPISSFTLGISALEELEQKIKEAEAYPILKVKLGTDYDLEILQEIRKWTDKPLRIDANEGWKTVAHAQEMIEQLMDFGVELVEQPLHASQKEDLVELKKVSPLPLCADESCTSLQDLPYLATAFDVINIKLMKTGSVLQSIAMAQQARNVGLKVMVGCMLESPMAIMAGAYIASWAHYADLDGAFLLSDSCFQQPKHDGEYRLLLNEEPGFGVSLTTPIQNFLTTLS